MLILHSGRFLPEWRHRESAHRHRKCLVATLHTRKELRVNDAQELVYATQALIGAVDTSVVLCRPRSIPTLYWRGRDIQEEQLHVRFEDETCTWGLAPVAEERVEKTAERQAILQAILGAGRPLLAREIAEALGKNYGTTRNVIARMVKQGERPVGPLFKKI